MKDLAIKPSSAPILENCVHRRLRRLTEDATKSALGEKLLAKRQLELPPYEAVPFSGWGDWEQDPLQDRSWQWRLNWFSFLPNLIAYHRDSGEDSALDLARDAIQSWIDAYLNVNIDYPFEFAWHDHATALRAEQMAMFIYYCAEDAQKYVRDNNDFFSSLVHALIIHAEWLAKDGFYSEHTNHGLEQARILLLLGTVLDHGEAHEWQQIGIRRIRNELEFAFTTEGVHVENSPAYHIFVFKVFLGIIDDFPQELLGDLAKQFDQTSIKALNFITHILRPDGTLPPIGDSEQLPTTDVYGEMFGERLEYQHLLYALTQGKRGVVPPVLNRIYPRSGYAIFRDEWPASEGYRNAFHLIAKVGCSSRYHHQQDEGHISLYAGGEDWLIDSGLYNYRSQDPLRKYMRGRLAHNVPIISHANYSERFEHRLSAWKVTAHSAAEPCPNLVMKLDVLTAVEHERLVAFDAASKVLKVGDKISAHDGRQRDITLQWHFPEDKTLTFKGSQIIVTSSTGNQLTIDFAGDAPDNLSVVKGRKGHRIFSYVSHKVNQVEPSQLLRVVFKKRRGLDVTTRFGFSIAYSPRAIDRKVPRKAIGVKDKPSMPDDESAYLTEVYEDAHVILEYGSGGSTRVAAHMPDKFIMSVESDLDWARQLRRDLASAASPVILQHIDIGEVGLWGRPLTDQSWRGYHKYSNFVWDQPWFRQPDVVLIDGRFRTACLAAVILRTTRPVKVLFDDYGVRERYQLIERLIKPDKMIGRMAEFSVKPGAYSPSDIGFLIEQFFWMTVHGEGEEAYRLADQAEAGRGAVS